jgi:Flp pilus assembly pilin Flp
MQRFANFLKDETGAVTVDWVVLTAAIVTIAMLIYPFFRSPVSDLAQAIATEVVDAQDYMD